MAAAAVVGGGPAGLMAAEVLATAGLAVTVFERMPTVGRKFQVAGRGGLNLTHSEPLPAFLTRYGAAEPFVAPAIQRFGPEALRAWSDGLGQPTFVGSSGRVFPQAFRSTPLLRAWLRRLEELGVAIHTRHTWLGWADDGSIQVRDGTGELVASRPDVCVLALGGASWPRTGSDGAWVGPLTSVGIDVVPLRPANCGFVVSWSDVFRDRFAGEPLKDVALHHDGATARGDVVITRDGIEGGPVYALSSRLRTTLEGRVDARLDVDLFPDATTADIDARLARRRGKDSASTGLRRAGLGPVAIGLLREVTGNRIPHDAASLGALVQHATLTLVAPRPIERAISTAGGVALEAVDERLMLRARPGTFVAGEMLDWEAPTGGYLLQAACSTGVAAADGALAWLSARPSPGARSGLGDVPVPPPDRTGA
jgi:uncharacterized flavoprotein (TIGR03862 family)